MTPRREVVDAWCRSNLGAGVRDLLFESGYLSVVLGVRLDDGECVVLKVRAPEPRLDACHHVQSHLHRAGFPCPEPLVGPGPFGEGLAVTVERMVPGGTSLPTAGRAPALFAAPLARLVALAPPPAADLPLDPEPSWCAWDQGPDRLWPRIEDHDVDLEGVGGPDWLDRAAELARERLRLDAGVPVVGHGDWYAGNLRWDGDRLLVVHDWDSTIAEREDVIVGFAAAVWATVRSGEDPSIPETAAFIEAYEAARGSVFTADERQRAWAAGLWLRAFDAKKQHVTQGHIRALTSTEADGRIRMFTD